MVRDLTKGSPTRLIVSFAMTMLLASLMNYIYNFTDSLMVGRFVNAEALGAVSASSPFIMLMNNFSFSILSGISIVMGQFFGAHDERRMRRLMANGIYLTAIIVSGATLFSIVVSYPVLWLMKTPQELLGDAWIYTVIILLAKPVSAPSWLLGGIFRSLGDTKTPLYIAMINGLGNVFFNFLFLVVFPMGVAGAALGTLCSAATGSIIYIVIYRKKMKMLHFTREEAGFSKELMRRLLTLGIPLGLESSITTFGSLILQTAINDHGAEAVTGISTGGKIMSFVWILFGVFESALLAFCAQNIGAGRLDRARRGIRNTLFINFGVGAVMLLFALIPAGGYTLDQYVYLAFVGGDTTIDVERVIGFAHWYLVTQVAFFPFISMLFTWRAGLKSFGSTVPTVLCGVIELIARIAISVVSLCMVGTAEFEMGLLFFAGPAAWVGTSVFLAILYPIMARRMARKMAPKGEIVPEKEELPTA